MAACGDDDPSPGSGGAGGHADGGGGTHAEGGGPAGEGGNAEGGGPAGEGGNAEGGGPAGEGGNAEGGGPAGEGGNAEGGGPAGEGGNAEGGGPAGEGGGPTGAGGLDPVELAIGTEEDATSGCATFVNGVWGVDETSFFEGEATNGECALVPVRVDGDAYWITSRDFGGQIDVYDLNYSMLSADARIEETSSSFVLLDTAFEEIFSGTITVTSLADDSVTLSIE
ncbi:hypothetical protein AB3662_39830 [Sorangium cellulosum]|uniref:hypothetical protein n=1 Tax=Sorangium cellulosum TaxID=56 RepID=UPI003D9A2688